MSDSFVVHIVDDDEAVRQSLAFLLSTAGVPVRVYDSATSFLDALPSLQSGCLITDVRMPDMTGIELLQRLKAKSIDLPVIVITGHGDIPLAVEAMKSGAIDFIEKPFAEEAILKAVAGREAHAGKARQAIRGGSGGSGTAQIPVRARAPGARRSRGRQRQQDHRS